MVLSSKNIRWLIIISVLLITLITAVQLFWIQKVYRFEEKHFNANVTKSIKGLFRNMNLVAGNHFTFENSIELPVPEAYLAKIEKIPAIDSVSFFLSRELTDFDILTDCNVSVFDKSQNKYIASKYIDIPDAYDSASNRFNTPLFKRNYSYVSIYFPHRGNYIVKQMLFWFVSSGILLVVLVGFGFSIFYLYQQQFLNETQKGFVNNFTHEFKTPLSVIKIAAEVLQQPSIHEKPDKLSNYAGIIQSQATHLQNQLNRMLAIAYTEYRKLPLKKERFDANLLLEQAITNIHPLIHEKSGVLIFQDKCENAFIHADKSYILLALTNLLENAVKYSIKPVINVSTYMKGNDFCTAIKDNGIGIDKKQQRRIFDKFYRVMHGDLHQAKGFGLGLNFVKKIMEAHKGKITVISVPGKGSTFILKIPAG